MNNKFSAHSQINTTVIIVSSVLIHNDMKKIKWFIKWIGYRISCLFHGLKYAMDWDEFGQMEAWAEFERDHGDEIERFHFDAFIKYSDLEE